MNVSENPVTNISKSKYVIIGSRLAKLCFRGLCLDLLPLLLWISAYVIIMSRKPGPPNPYSLQPFVLFDAALCDNDKYSLHVPDDIGPWCIYLGVSLCEYLSIFSER